MNENKGFDVSGMPDQAIGVVTSPRAFFRAMPRDGGYLDPIVFLLVMGLAAALVQIILGFIGFGQAGIAGMAAIGLLAIIMLPLFLVVFGFITAAIGYVVWRFLGSNQSFETAFRCVAYMSAITPITSLLGAIPYFGTLAHVAWGMFLVVIASVEVHAVRERTAQIVFGVIGAILVLISVSNEYAARHLQAQFERMSGEFREDLDEKSPEEIGQAVGEFLKGLENATREGAQQGQ